MSESVEVAENGKGRYQQAVIVGQHQLIADEPESAGGSDAGPAPFDFVMAGLGACTSMTLRMYAERKELNLGKVSVALSHEKIDLDGIKRDRIQRTITLTGDLTAKQRQRMFEIANKCPVYRAISPSLLIETTLTEHAITP